MYSLRTLGLRNRQDRRNPIKMRKLIFLLTTVYFLGLFAVGAWVHQAAFPSWQQHTITGVIIGAFADEAGAVRISARSLQCNDPAGGDIYAPATCTGALAGGVLQIRATRNPPEHPNSLDGVCQADYNGQSWPCEMVWGYDIPSIHLTEPLGLDTDQLAALRRIYFVENLPEVAIVRGMIAAAVLTPLVVALASIAWLWPKRWHWVYRAVTPVLLAALTFVGTAIVAALITRGLWD